MHFYEHSKLCLWADVYSLALLQCESPGGQVGQSARSGRSEGNDENVCSLLLQAAEQHRPVYYTGCGRSRFAVVSVQNTEFLLVLLSTNYCISIVYMTTVSQLLLHPVCNSVL